MYLEWIFQRRNTTKKALSLLILFNIVQNLLCNKGECASALDKANAVATLTKGPLQDFWPSTDRAVPPQQRTLLHNIDWTGFQTHQQDRSSTNAYKKLITRLGWFWKDEQDQSKGQQRHILSCFFWEKYFKR